MSVTTDQAIADLKKLKRAALEEMAKEIDAATARLNDAQGRNIPVRTGDLLRSRFVEKAKIQGNRVSGAVGAGKDGEPFYAAIVHEVPNRKGHKFLEKEVVREIGPLEERFDIAATRASKRALRE